MNNGYFCTSEEFCNVLIEKGNIDTEGEAEHDLTDLSYIATRYLETNTKRDLIGIIKEYYSCKTVNDEHKTIARLPWKKVYTTNYDDVMETASKNIGINREVLVADDI